MHLLSPCRAQWSPALQPVSTHNFAELSAMLKASLLDYQDDFCYDKMAAHPQQISVCLLL